MLRTAAHVARGRNRSMRLLALVAGGTLAVSACSGSSGSPRRSTGTPSAAGGVLTMAEDLSNSSGAGVSFDPAETNSAAANVPWELPIYDSLLHYESSGALVPGLALGATITSPSSVSVRLRPGLVFSNGAPFDSTAVKSAILRNEHAPKHGQFNTTLYDVSSIDTPSPTSLVVHLDKPDAGSFYTLLAGPETFVGAPSATDPARAPIGAGPFELKQYVPNQKIVLVKNPRYWDAKNISLSGIDMVSVSLGPSAVNAVKAGEVDYAEVQLPDISAIRSDSSLRLVTASADDSLMSMPLCKSAAPLDNVQVRQALSYAINRSAINQALLQGAGEPAYAFWPEKSVFFPKNLSGTYAYDPAKAKQLLRQAGYANGFDLTMVVNSAVPIVSQAAQIVQSEWKAVGVNLTLKPSTNFVSDLYINHAGQTTINPVTNPGLEKLNAVTPGNIGDLCNYDNPQIDSIATKLKSLAPTSPQAVTLWDQLQDIISQQALFFWLDFSPIPIATSRHVADLNLVTSYIVPVPDYHTVNVNGS